MAESDLTFGRDPPFVRVRSAYAATLNAAQVVVYSAIAVAAVSIPMGASDSLVLSFAAVIAIGLAVRCYASEAVLMPTGFEVRGFFGRQARSWAEIEEITAVSSLTQWSTMIGFRGADGRVFAASATQFCGSVDDRHRLMTELQLAARRHNVRFNLALARNGTWGDAACIPDELRFQPGAKRSLRDRI